MENNNTIKVYRVIKDDLTPRIITSGYYPDDLFYYLGYVPFYGKINKGYANTIGMWQSEEGKYFFLFPEDALLYSSCLLNDLSYTAKIIEFEVPIESIFNNIGVGEYENNSIGFNYVTELIVSKSNFSGDILPSQDIDGKEKKKALLKSFRDTLETINKLPGAKLELSNQTEYLLGRLSDKRIASKLARFDSLNVELIKSNEITNRVFTIINSGCDETNLNDTNLEILQSGGLILDYSEEAKSFRNEVAYKLYSEHFDKARSLIKDHFMSR